MLHRNTLEGTNTFQPLMPWSALFVTSAEALRWRGKWFIWESLLTGDNQDRSCTSSAAWGEAEWAELQSSHSCHNSWEVVPWISLRCVWTPSAHDGQLHKAVASHAACAGEFVWSPNGFVNTSASGRVIQLLSLEWGMCCSMLSWHCWLWGDRKRVNEKFYCQQREGRERYPTDTRTTRELLCI